jgi:glycosidase
MKRLAARLALWVSLATALVGRGADSPIDLPEGVFFFEKEGAIEFGNEFVRLRFDSQTGAWLELSSNHGTNQWLNGTGKSGWEFRVEGQSNGPSFATKPAVHEIVVDRASRSVALRFIHLVDPNFANWGSGSFRLVSEYRIESGSERLIRQAEVTRLAGAYIGAFQFQGFSFDLAGVESGPPEECVVDVPGPFDPRNFVPPATPLPRLAARRLGFLSAPDTGFGIFAVTGKGRGTLATWLDTGAEVNYLGTLKSDGRSIDFQFRDERFYWLKPAMTVRSDPQQIWISPDLPGALGHYREMVERRMPPLRETPKWLRHAVILEAMASYYTNGFKGLADRLPFYHEVGFNTLYLMPHWRGGYSPLDLYEADPALGGKDELRKLVLRAHQLGYRVLFDMVIHGFDEKSEVPVKHPDLFVHDADGHLAKHPVWKSITPDWASPKYVAYMRDLVRHDVREYWVDGYRVDAASYKGPGWDPSLPYPAYRPGTAGPDLLRSLRAELTAENRYGVLLNEIFGPGYYQVCDLAHDNMTMGPQLFLEMLATNAVTADDYKAYLASVQEALPPGLKRVYFARNHDTSWFYHFNGYTPRFLALDAIHAFVGIPEVFAGDPNRRRAQNPDDDPAIFEFYRRLFKLRRRNAAITEGQARYRDVTAGNPMIFAAVKQRGSDWALLLSSLSSREEHASVTLPDLTLPKTLRLREVRSDKVQKIRATRSGGEIHFEFDLKAGEVWMGGN